MYSSTRATLTLSVALTETFTVPDTFERVVGDVITTVGGSESDALFWTVALTEVDVPTWPASSYALARSVAAVGDGRRVPGEGVRTGRISSLPHVVHVEFHPRNSDIVGRGGCRCNRAGNSLSVARRCDGAGRRDRKSGV